MAKLSKILLGSFAFGHSEVIYETVSCNNDENVRLTNSLREGLREFSANFIAILFFRNLNLHIR